MSEQQTPDQDALVQRLWKNFKETGTWLDRRLVYLELDDKGIDLDALIKGTGIRSSDGGNGPAQLKLTFEALLSIPEVPKLLEPVPAALRLAAVRFVEKPFGLNDRGERPEVTMAELEAIWGDHGRLILACRVLDEYHGATPLHVSGTGRNGEFCVKPGLDSLFYEDVQSLEKALTAPNPWHSDLISGPPSGPHLALLVAILDSLRKNRRWPSALPFAVENRSIGFVPRLVSALYPRFIRDSFSDNSFSRLRLAAGAVPHLPLTETELRDLVGLMKAMYSVYRRVGPNELVTVTALAEEMKRPVDSLLPLCLLIEDEPWVRSAYPGNETPGYEWGARPEEKVAKFRQIKTWDEYWALRREHYPHWYDLRETETYSGGFGAEDFGGLTVEGYGSLITAEESLSATEVPALPLDFAFVAEQDMKALLERNLRELSTARHHGLHTAAITLAGSIAEGLLYDALNQIHAKAVAASKAQRDGKTKQVVSLKDWKLYKYIEVAEELKLISPSLTQMTHNVLRNFRNMIHPRVQLDQGLVPNAEEMDSSIVMLRALVRDLAKAKKDGLLTP